MIICLLIPLSTVSASDINNTADDQVLSATPSVDTLSASVNPEQKNDTLSVQNDENLLSAGSDSGSELLSANDNAGNFKDLRSLIKLSKDHLDLNINYTRDTSDTNTIDISKSNFVLDGHGNTIDLNNASNNIFSVTGNNVTIKNLIIINSTADWPIVWKGSDGEIDNVIIQDCSAAILWSGQKGLINNTKIIRSTYSSRNPPDGAFAIRVEACSVNLYNSEFINCSGCIGSRDANPCEFISIDNVNFTGCKNTIEAWGTIVFPSYGQLILKNSRIVDCQGVDSVIASYYTPMIIYNCLFENNTQNMRNVRYISGGVLLDRCGGSTISYCNFTNNLVNSGGTVVAGASTIDHCIFTNNTMTSDPNYTPYANSILTNANGVFSDSGNTVISNCVFKDHNNTKNPLFGYTQTATVSGFDIRNCEIYNNNLSCIIGDFDSASNSHPDMFDLSNTVMHDNFFKNGMFNFTENINLIYADNTTLAYNNHNTTNTFDGIDNSAYLNSFELMDVVYANPSNITEGLALVKSGGILYLDGGIYTTNATVETSTNIFAFSKPIKIIGKRDSTIFESSIYSYFAPYLELHNFTMRNAYIRATDSPYLVCNNITLDNSSDDLAKYFINTYHGFGINYTNMIIKNVNDKSYHWQSSASKLTYSNITFEDCNNININFYQAKFSSFNNITFKDSNCSNFNFNPAGGELNNITLSNLSLSSGSYTISGTTSSVFNLTVDNIRAPNTDVLLDVLYNLDVANISNINQRADGNTLFGNFAINWSNITISNVSVSTIMKNKLTGNLNGLNISKSNFTSDVIFTCGDNIVLNKINLSSFKGHIVVDGANVKLLDSDFTEANNTGLNGSCILVKNDFFNAVNSRFISNNASNGTVYIDHDCKRPVLNNCTFTDNNAEYKGGALYLVSTPEEHAVIVIDTSTNATILYPESSGWKHEGYNDFYGFLADFFTELYLVNDTSNWYPESSIHDGHSRETATSNMQYVYNLIDGGHVYFVRPDDVFTSPIQHPVTSTFANVTFHGNNTTLVHYGITINDNGVGMKIYNITFKDFTDDSACIINAEGCLIDNCSFVNVGGANVKYGGAIQVNANDISIVNSSFINARALHVNATSHEADALGGAIYVNASNIRVEDCDFKENSVSNTGSHIYIDENCDNINLIHNNFTSGNVSELYNGAGVSIQGSNILVTGNNFTNNSGLVGSGLNVIGEVTLVNVIGNLFANNTVTSAGGALYLEYTNSLKQNVIISNNYFINNSADISGGALYVGVCDLFGLSMTGNAYVNNSAVNGGAIFIDCPGFTLNDVDTLENNTAVNGGGVYVDADDVTIRDVDFTGNNATLGGALYVNALNTNVIDSDFIANTANTLSSRGSAVYVSENGGVTLIKVLLNKNYVFGENSTFQRGDIYVDHGKFADKGITYGSEPYKQYLSNMSVLTLTIAYVSETGGGSGISADSPTTLTNVFDLLGPDSIIYIVDGDLTANNFALNNLDNVTIVNYPDGKNRKIKGNDKYLFINLK